MFELTNEMVKFKFQYDNTLSNFSNTSIASSNLFKFQYDNTLSYTILQ